MHRSAQKEAIRKELLEARRRMTFEEVYAVSLAVQKNFLMSPLFAGAGRLSLYSSFRNEVLTDEIFQKAMEAGKEVYYPRVIREGDGRLGFYRVNDLKELSSGSYEIPEPGEKEVRIGPGTLELVVMPGIAFDEKGSRIGYGKGYYDRALKSIRCPAVALAYDFQVLKKEIPSEPHDVRVSAIFTEKRIITV